MVETLLGGLLKSFGRKPMAVLRHPYMSRYLILDITSWLT